MTCRSHPWTYPAEKGHSSHDRSASLHCLLSEWSERLSRGRTLASSSGRVLLSVSKWGRQARLHGPDQGASRREDSRIERQHAIICGGFESVERYCFSPHQPNLRYLLQSSA